MRSLAWALGLPLLVGGMSLLLVGPERAAGVPAASARLGVYLIGLLGTGWIGLGALNRCSARAEGVGILVSGAVASGLVSLSGAAGGGLWAAGVAVGATALLWTVSLPLRALGWESGGRILWVLGAAAGLSTPWWASRGPDGLPAWMFLNPLIRWHGSIRGEDWLHGPTLYGRVGEGYYAYPDPGSSLGFLVAVAAGCLIFSAVILRARGPGEGPPRRG